MRLRAIAQSRYCLTLLVALVFSCLQGGCHDRESRKLPGDFILRRHDGVFYVLDHNEWMSGPQGNSKTRHLAISRTKLLSNRWLLCEVINRLSYDQVEAYSLLDTTTSQWITCKTLSELAAAVVGTDARDLGKELVSPSWD